MELIAGARVDSGHEFLSLLSQPEVCVCVNNTLVFVSGAEFFSPSSRRCQAGFYTHGNKQCLLHSCLHLK